MPKNIMPEIESVNIEYKESLSSNHKHYLKTVVAFANGSGGTLIFGIRDSDRAVIGIPSAKLSQTIDAITNAIVDSCEPAIIPDFQLQTIDDKTIIRVQISKGMQKPYYIKAEGMLDGVYIRMGGTTRHTPRYLVQGLIVTTMN